jgi:predicted small secreted protein
MKKILTAVCLLVIAVTALGCHTVHGAGEDIESAGQHIEHAAH